MTPRTAATLLTALLAFLTLGVFGAYLAGFPLEQPAELALALGAGAAIGVPVGVLIHRHGRV